MHQNATNHGLFTGSASAALAATLVIHASIMAGVIWGGWLDVAKISPAVKSKNRMVTVKLSATPPKKSREPENQFVPVNPETRTKERPKKETPYYSNANSIASNPNPPEKPRDTPRIKESVAMAPGSFNSPTPALTAFRTARSQPNLSPSEALAKAKPTLLKPNFDGFGPAPITGKPTSRINPSTSRQNSIPLPATKQKQNTSLLPNLPEGPKAPTLQEAKAGLGNRSMKQAGGVARQGPAALDVRLTGYGDYDARFFAAISIAWRKQIKNRTWSPSQVIVDFSLFHDGRIEDLTLRETKAANILQYFCREAIQQPAPFEPWTESMRKELGNGPRRCRITFNYLVR
jgi:hypothetical protein